MIPRKVTDETGNRYGRWAVLRYAGCDKKGAAQWLCHCDCGAERVVAGSSLRYGNSQSCGCLRRERASKAFVIDLTGQTFGRLTVLQRVGTSEDGQATWLCKCKCRNETIVRGASLRRGDTRSCGCWVKDMPRGLSKGVASFNALFGNIKSNAKRRGHKWYLTKEQFRHLTKQPCHYCGVRPLQTFGYQYNGVYLYNGLDRVDNTQGYTIDNVVPCCKTGNHAKNDQTIGEFEDWVIRVSGHFMRSGRSE